MIPCDAGLRQSPCWSPGDRAIHGVGLDPDIEVEISEEDIVQEAFLRSYRALPDFNPKYRFSTWLYRIAFNRAASVARKIGSVGKPPQGMLEMKIVHEDDNGVPGGERGE